MGESSTTLHLIVRSQWGVSVEPDLLVADFGSNAEFACNIDSKDDEHRTTTTSKAQGKNCSHQKLTRPLGRPWKKCIAMKMEKLGGGGTHGGNIILSYNRGFSLSSLS